MFDGQGVETDVIRLSNARIQILLTTGVHAFFRRIICKLALQTTHIYLFLSYMNEYMGGWWIKIHQNMNE